MLQGICRPYAKHWIVVQPMHLDEESELGCFGEQDCYFVREAQDPLPKFRLLELKLTFPLSCCKDKI